MVSVRAMRIAHFMWGHRATSGPPRHLANANVRGEVPPLREHRVQVAATSVGTPRCVTKRLRSRHRCARQIGVTARRYSMALQGEIIVRWSPAKPDYPHTHCLLFKRALALDRIVERDRSIGEMLRRRRGADRRGAGGECRHEASCQAPRCVPSAHQRLDARRHRCGHRTWPG
jgi:hypothetical protein